MDSERIAERERALKKINKTRTSMAGACVVFAIAAFVLWVVSRDSDSAFATACFGASLALAVVFAVISVAMGRIYKFLILLDIRK